MLISHRLPQMENKKAAQLGGKKEENMKDIIIKPASELREGSIQPSRPPRPSAPASQPPTQAGTPSHK